MDKILLYDQLREAKKNLDNNFIDGVAHEVRDILSIDDPARCQIRILQQQVMQELTKLSIDIQADTQTVGVQREKIDKTPHLDDTLRANRLGEHMSYPDRLSYVLSIPGHYAKINKKYLESKKNEPGYRGKSKNKTAVENNIKKDFFAQHFVLDPNKVTEQMSTYLLDGHTVEHYMSDPQLKGIKSKFAHPYFLQYELPGATPDSKPTKKATSRITFFRNTPAIGVFRSADTHPMVADPTKHEQRKIAKNMDMYITNSSYDLITQQYKSIQHIMQNKEFTADLLQELQKLVQDKSFGPDEKLQISQAIDAISGQINPHTLMARLYNLSRIEDFANKTVQQNLLLGALNKIDKRHKQLGQYLYYMIPQLDALQTIHTKNIENMETLHRSALMSASGNNPRAFVGDKRKQMEQFNKHDPLKKVERALRQHPIEQKDHLIGMFYSMHKQLGIILKNPDLQERKELTKIAVYTHRLVMAAEQLKQDITLGIVQKPEQIVPYFADTWAAIGDAFDKSVVQKFFGWLYDMMPTIQNHIARNNMSKAQKELSKFKIVLEPIAKD